MSTLNQIRQTIKQEKAAKKKLAVTIQSARAQLQKNAKNRAAGDTQTPGVTAPVNDSIAGIEEHAGNITDLLGQLYLQTPQQLVEQLSDENPFLLFPVKIETKFKALSDGSKELWIRIFPDDIAIHTHETLLTEDEYNSGMNYWSTLLLSPDEATNQSAWNTLVAISGANRASWVIRQTKPLNWDLSPAETDTLQFPVYTEFKSGSWTEAPHSKIMPDKFVVTGYSGNMVVFEKEGNIIPDDLQMAPDPSSEETQLSRDKITGEITVNEKISWLFSFTKAEEAGMAMRIPLVTPYDTTGFDRLIVLGLRISTAPDEGSLLIEELIDNHHYSLNGFSFVKQGTPTNNTEDDASGYDSAEDSYETETGDPLFTATTDTAAKTDAQLFAEALAINYDPLYHITNSNATDVQEAVLMNTALWPGTLGYFMNEMMCPVFTEEQVEFTRDYFNAYVSGRGSVAAIRVGNQPYGILPVSAFSKWKWSDEEAGKNVSYYEELYNALSKLQAAWKTLSIKPGYAGKAGDPFSLLLDIIGLQAGSVDFYQRIGTDDEFTWNWLSYQDRSVAVRWNTMVEQLRNSMITQTGFTFSELPKIMELNFLETQNQLTGALVDDNSELSETATIAAFDAVNNYINWLLNSDTQTITDQVFTDASGGDTAAPKALLYLALRNAYLQQVWLNVDRLYKQQELVTGSYKDQSVLNIRAEPAMTKMDYMFTDVNSILPASITGNTSLYAADFVMQPAVLNLIGNQYLTQMKTALGKLAGLPTARLERLFTEHLDLCSYRLDAWQTGFFSKRLEYLRNKPGSVDQSTPKGTYIGAFGWLEDIRPATSAKTEVSATALPEKLREPGKGKVYEDSANGGYIHGFSLNHALTGAVLRSAYLSHADDTNADTMSVNLSSERVRNAMYYLDGVRNGQTLSSLLGYQLERGLHDNTSLNLDEYIYALREKYPLLSSELEASDSTENIAASNVVDGYALLEAYKTESYPYGVTGLPATGSSEEKAITTEIDKLADAMDSIGDLALSESVYQVVQGNYERGGAVMKSFSEGKNPADPQIVNTPRKGTMITNRIAIHFEADPVGNPWGTTLTPRATAEKGLNKWLSSIIPDPASIACVVNCVYTDGETGLDITVRSTVTVLQLDIQPIDFVLMVDKSFGTGTSEIEKRIAYRFKNDNAVSDSIIAEIQFRERDSSWSESIVSFLELIPLLKNLHDIITQCRPLHALDLDLPAASQGTGSSNTKGYDTDEIKNSSLNGRLDNTNTDLETKQAALSTAMASVTEPYTQEAFTVWRTALINITGFGITEAFPASYAGYSAVEYSLLKTQSDTILSIVTDRLNRARQLLDAAASEVTLPDNPTEAELMQDASRKKEELFANYTTAAKLLLGSNFTLVPKFALYNHADIKLAVDNSANLLRYSTNDQQLPFIASEWLQGIGKVRKRAANLDEAIMYQQNIYGSEITLTPYQLPYDASHHWVAVEYPEEMVIDQDMVAITAVLPAGYDTANTQCGLLLDDWTELIPGKKETTGVAFHYDQPNAMPPQSLLLAVTPELKGNWTWQDLMDTLNDTLDRAKCRAVEPDHIDDSAYAQFLPAIMTAFSNEPVTISTYWAQNITGKVLTNLIK